MGSSLRPPPQETLWASTNLGSFYASRSLASKRTQKHLWKNDARIQWHHQHLPGCTPYPEIHYTCSYHLAFAHTSSHVPSQNWYATNLPSVFLKDTKLFSGLEPQHMLYLECCFFYSSTLGQLMPQGSMTFSHWGLLLWPWESWTNRIVSRSHQWHLAHVPLAMSLLSWPPPTSHSDGKDLNSRLPFLLCRDPTKACSNCAQ